MITEKWFTEERDNKVVGKMCSKLYARHYRQWLFCHGWVDPEYRRKGIFTKLWKERMAWTLEQNPRSIFGWCNYRNEPLFIKDNFSHVSTDEETHEKLMELIVETKNGKLE